jgi:hypothetical protein
VRQWLKGQLPVEVRGRLTAEKGIARVEITRTEVAGLPIPTTLLQDIVTYYSRSPEFPSGVDLGAPFELPARIREIHVNARQAVVIQE